MTFENKIVEWYKENQRELPWRKTKDPYKIWLSEVLLQQTRVVQGMSYYVKFVEEFPRIEDLASATEERVLNLWQGLGYYSRARNLHFAAKQIINDFNGDFPKTYKTILKLKGVGEYTAAAIASICFEEKEAVVDGNVYRVLSRCFEIATPIDTSKGKKEFKELANALLKDSQPSLFNQGTMELGATVCTPKTPQCSICPLESVCVVAGKSTQLDYPFKSKKVKQKDRYFNYLVIKNKDQFYIEKRVGRGIWENMYQFPLIETFGEKENWNNEVDGLKLIAVSKQLKHVLSHQNIYAKFWELEVRKDKGWIVKNNWNKVSLDDIEHKPLPRLIENYISQSRWLRSD